VLRDSGRVAPPPRPNLKAAVSTGPASTSLVEMSRMLPTVAAFGIVFFCLTLWCSVTVARMRDLPTWRRFLPLTLFLIAAGASLLRAVDIPEVANAVAFPLNLAVVLLSLREFRSRRQHTREADRPAR
ncbi:hypothetical protein ABZY10_05960, partial [Streptomyces sp. NPDC006539]|uniref:hypothetical protein n=2 Tax=Streptomyces TaxID=1883 RepID=UPI0033AACE59